MECSSQASQRRRRVVARPTQAMDICEHEQHAVMPRVVAGQSWVKARPNQLSAVTLILTIYPTLQQHGHLGRRRSGAQGRQRIGPFFTPVADTYTHRCEGEVPGLQHWML